MHMKGTLVRQAASSTYKLTEARLGGRLTRQDVNVAQVRHLAGILQCHDTYFNWCTLPVLARTLLVMCLRVCTVPQG